VRHQRCLGFKIEHAQLPRGAKVDALREVDRQKDNREGGGEVSARKAGQCCFSDGGSGLFEGEQEGEWEWKVNQVEITGESGC